MLKRSKSIFVLVLFYLSTVTVLSASHIVGGELYYECLGFTNGDPSSGSMRYQIYMKIYRDVLGGGADFDSAPGSIDASVSIYRGQDGTILPTQFLPPPDRTNVNPNPGSDCVLIPPTIRIEQGLYRFREIDLPISDESYYIVYQRCCRTELLTNIFDPALSGATYFVEITPAAQQICNNSPVFKDFPPFLICANETFSVDHAATDVDGHRLEYAFCSPFLGGGQDAMNLNNFNSIAPDPDSPPPFDPVAFISPLYSAQEPLGSASDFKIDQNTGIITGTPIVEGQFVVGVCVREYDDRDSLLSEIRRDFQFIVSKCERSIVVDIESDSINTEGAFVLNVCGSDDVLIENNSTQSSEVSTFFWEFDINGTTEQFTDFSPSPSFPEAGVYEGRFFIKGVTGCLDTGLVSLRVVDAAQANFEVVSDPCESETTEFNNTSTVPGGLSVAWQWDFGDQAGTSTDFSPSYNYASAGTRPVMLTAISDGLCRDSITRDIDFFPLPSNIPINSQQDQGCLPQLAQFEVLYPFINDAYDVRWNFGDGNVANGANVVHTYEQAGTFATEINILSPNGCAFEATLPAIDYVASPVADFSFTPTDPSSLESTVNFTDQSSNASSWNWTFGNVGTSTAFNPVFTFPDSAASYPVELIVTHPNGCTDTVQQILTIRAIDDFYIPNAFTPDNDGINDEFRGFGPLGGRQDFEMAVFSRWGDRVFYTRNPNEGWNGQKNNNGLELPSGAYVYYVTFKNANGVPITLKGLVNLLK
ncbi:MAG: PKD domain-containing protein [Bacteroidota bacterium]